MRHVGSTTWELFSRCISYLFIGSCGSRSRAILARVLDYYVGKGSIYKSSGGGDGGGSSRCTIPFAPFSSLPRFQAAAWIEIGTAKPAGPVARRDGVEKQGIGVRAEVTPAPRWSRSRAPVRSDALLSFSLLSGSTISPLRHLFDLPLSCPPWPFTTSTFFPNSWSGCIKC